MIFGILLQKVIAEGHLVVIDAYGWTHSFGDSAAAETVTIKLHNPALHWQLAVNPRLYIGEAYMDGSLTVESDGSIYDFLALIVKNTAHKKVSFVDQMSMFCRSLLRRISQSNKIRRSKLNVAHHYDLSTEMYEMFLDSRRQYSCAYFAEPGFSLERAQLAKLDHITSKLLVEPGQSVLDIGCGWGGLAMHIAETTGALVTGITLSEEQHAYANAKAKERGLADRVSFHLRDYRKETGVYDRIVSVGMFEHVGVPNYDTFFETIRDRLEADGVAMMHTIVQGGTPWPTNPWLAKYIFPGGYCPAVSEVAQAIERSGLWNCDMECWRLHYAETLRHWRDSFTARWSDAAALYDERFCRMWEFYLAGSEVGFRHDNMMVAQFQLARQRDAVPLTRDYLYAPEATATDRKRGYRPRRIA